MKLIPAILFAAFFLVCMIDLYNKTLPHRCEGGDIESEEGTRLLEWIFEAQRQAWVNKVEADINK